MGWKSPEGKAFLDSWEEVARLRLARVAAGETLEAVYEEGGEEDRQRASPEAGR